MKIVLALASLVLLGALLPACSSTTSSKSENLTPESELPPDYAAAWRAWYEADESWAEWRPRVAEDERFANFFTDNLLRVMVTHYEHSGLSKRGDLPGLFERSQRELIFLEDHSGPKVVELGFVADSIVARLCFELLLRMDDGRWTLLVAEKLASEDMESRRRAAEWLKQLPHAADGEERVWELLDIASRDPEWSVRAQVAVAVGDRSLAYGSLDRARPLLSRALADDDPLVVKSACRGFATNLDRRAVPAVINLLDRLDRTTRDPVLLAAGQECLTYLTGIPGPNAPGVWRAWWRENRPAER